MPKIVLGVTGSVAAVRTPSLFTSLTSLGHVVRVVATEPALHFFDPFELPHHEEPADRVLYRDRDEWPVTRWQRDDPVLHIEFRRWADLLVIAPLDANTLGKIALGLCDSFLTCLFRAWDFSRPVILAPAMNTLMWDSPSTRRHFRSLLEDHGDGAHPTSWSLDDVDLVFARHAPRIVVVPPQSKRLACGDIGTGAMAEVAAIAEVVRRSAGS
jgi:phosphopantothenoylcysteine decarboxylase